MCRSSPTNRRTVSQRSTFPLFPLSFFRTPADLSMCPRIICCGSTPRGFHRRRLRCRRAPFVYSTGFRHRPRRLSSLLIARYRAYISICVTTRSTAYLRDPSACRFIAVVTTSPGNARRLQKSIAIGDTRTSTRANGRFFVELTIARELRYPYNF